MLLATAACNFSCVLCRATSAPAALARLLFDPADTQNIEKTQRFVISLTFRACGSSFFPHLLIFFLAALLFQLSILSEVRLLNFLRQGQTDTVSQAVGNSWQVSWAVKTRSACRCSLLVKKAVAATASGLRSEAHILQVLDLVTSGIKI